MSNQFCRACNLPVDANADACPGCGITLLVAAEPAASASENPYASPAADSYASPASSPAAGGFPLLREIAVRQKWVLYVLLLNVACSVFIMTLGRNEQLRSVGQLLLLLTAPIQIVCFIRLASSLKMSTLITVLYSIALFIPCISLLVLMTVNSKATTALQKAGIRVGLMGAKLSTIK